MNILIIPGAIALLLVVLFRDARRAAPSYFVNGGTVLLSLSEPGISNKIVSVQVRGDHLYEETRTGKNDWQLVGRIDLEDMVISYNGQSWYLKGWTLWPFRLPLTGVPVQGNVKLTIGIPHPM